LICSILYESNVWRLKQVKVLCVVCVLRFRTYEIFYILQIKKKIN
jgi:hypothetical protein